MMRYSTCFSGTIGLSRKLSYGEAKELLSIRELPSSQKITGVDSKLQWVPNQNFDAIVWDQDGKFHDYVKLMKWLCEKWLLERGVKADGEIRWQGDFMDDAGIISVKDNVVTATIFNFPNNHQSIEKAALPKAA